MAQWTAFPHDASAYIYDEAALRRHWSRLHAGDAEPMPGDPQVLAAWRLFHAGEFEAACAAGLQAGGAGITVANKAQSVYANHLEKSEQTRLALFTDVAGRAEAQLTADLTNASAWYFLGHALARCSQGTSIAKALAQGVGNKIRSALETAIRLAPGHADAHIALGAFHAQAIDQVGSLLGRAQGARKDTGLAMFRTALTLNPGSASAMVEYATGLVMLEGDTKMSLATQLYQNAAATTPMDATERLDVEMARAGLED